MSNKQSGRDEEKAEEARHIAEDAVEAAQEGNDAEAKFLAGEAKELDRDAAVEVLAPAGLSGKGGTQ